MNTNPIFIVGNVHSGTTLLRRILGAHATVYEVGGETQLFHYLPLHRRCYPNLEDEKTLRAYITYVAKVGKTHYGFVHNWPQDKPAPLAEFSLDESQIDGMMIEAKGITNHGEVIKVVMDYIARSAGKDRWMDKTPGHLLCIDQIIKDIPEAQFVELVRDPRDILSSKRSRSSAEWMQRRLKIVPNIQKYIRFQTGYDPVWDSLTWKSAIRIGTQAQQKHQGQVMRVRYEDLVTEPEQVVTAVCDFLDLSFSAEMLNVGWSNNTTQVGSKKGNGIGTSAIGKGMRLLPREAIIVSQWFTGKEMDALGYERLPISFTAALKLPFVLVKSVIELLQRVYRRWRFGGFYYLKDILFGNMMARFRKSFRPK